MDITRGDYIREIREYLKLTQEELGIMLGMGSRSVNAYEHDYFKLTDLEWNGFLLAFFQRARQMCWDYESGMEDYDREYINEMHWQIVDMVIFNNNLSFFEKRILAKKGSEKSVDWHKWYEVMKKDLIENGAIGVEVDPTAESNYLYAVFKLAARNRIYEYEHTYGSENSLFMISKRKYSFEEAKEIVGEPPKYMKNKENK